MNLKDILSTVAPSLGLALGGPLGALAGKVLSATLGTKDVKSAEAAILAGDPEVMLKVKQAEIAFNQHIADLGVTMEQLSVDDRKSARALQLGTHSYLQPSLAVMIVVAFIVMVGTTLLGLSHADGALAGTLIGYLSAKCEQVISFYFGSSAGSDRKTELMAQAK